MENTLFVSSCRLLDAACLLFAQSLFTFTSTQRVSALTAFRIMRLCHNGPFVWPSDGVRRKSGGGPAQRGLSVSLGLVSGLYEKRPDSGAVF